jgi:hypothetical protein
MLITKLFMKCWHLENKKYIRNLYEADATDAKEDSSANFT